jgi:succinate-semialdehyde dehydrogenase/glutarate-semialdehyde dehydrogenase
MNSRVLNAVADPQSFDLSLAGHSIPTGLFIAGQWREASAGGRIDVIDPSTESVIASVADASVEDALSCVDAAAQAAPGWAATAPRERGEFLRRCFERIVANVDWLAHLISLENGKALADARSEVLYAAEFFRWYAEEAVRLIGEISLSPGGTNRIVVQHQPIGIALLVTPWNFPSAMATRKIAPALAAGCTCILKPATETPLTALAILKIMQEAGLPAGVVNVFTTRQSGRAVDAILHDDRVRKLSFTGSTEVGRLLLRGAADTVINCAMELGGNAPFLVLADADIPEAIEGALIAKMRNGGEACTAANRFYVQRGVYDAFTAQLVKRMGAIKVGEGCLPTTGCGPLINQAAVEHVQALVDDAVSRGAKILVGGHAPEGTGYFFPPTVLVDVPRDATIVREEIFGPVAVIMAFDTIDEAVALANDTEFGLAAYLYTSDMKVGLQVAQRLEAGMVALNRGLVSDPAAPFGGVKQSGLGREGAHHGLLEFTETKYVAVTW